MSHRVQASLNVSMVSCKHFTPCVQHVTVVENLEISPTPIGPIYRHWFKMPFGGPVQWTPFDRWCPEVVNPYGTYDAIFGLECRAIGRVRKDSVIDGENIVAGDVLIGLPSSGVHCWGFSLVSRVLAQSGLSLKDQLPGGSGKPITLGEALMVPTVIYVKQVLDIISKGGVKGIAHITCGGFMKSIPRVFTKGLGLGATIYKDTGEVPAVFKLIREAGRIEDAEMRRTFNMGIGMVLVVSPDAATRILGEQHGGYSAFRIGEVTMGEGVTYR